MSTLTRRGPQIVALALAALVTLVAASGDADAHHTHHYPWYTYTVSTLSGTRYVYNCDANATNVQEAVNRWNTYGGIGTMLTYGGTSCSTGIYFKQASLGGYWGQATPESFGQRQRELVKDRSRGQGRFYFGGYWRPAMLEVSKVKIEIDDDQLSNLDVYLHELGHTIGLHEHYRDVDGPDCSYQNANSVMDCYGSTPGSHDQSDLIGRWNTYSPWGTGAIWITSDTGTTLFLNWADINDDDTGVDIYKNGVRIATSVRNQQQRYISGLTPGANDSFYVCAKNAKGSGCSYSISRQTQPGIPAAPSGVSVGYYGGAGYQAQVTFYNNSSANTHHRVNVLRWVGGQWTMWQQYYVTWKPVGWVTTLVQLNWPYDPLNQNYLFRVYACNQKYNDLAGTACLLGGGQVELYMYPTYP